MIIVPGPASQILGKKIAEELNVKKVDLNLKTFPDGEYSLRYEEKIAGEEVSHGNLHRNN